MSGVSYIVNEKGERTAVIIDLLTNADVWKISMMFCLLLSVKQSRWSYDNY